MRRISMMISPITSSATERVLENGALKTGIPRLRAAFQFHLIGADRKAADCDQTVGSGENLLGQLRTRANADDMRRRNRLDQIGLVQCFRQMCDIGVAGGFEIFHGGLADAFQKKNIDAITGEGEAFGHFGSFQAETADGRFTT